MPVVFFRFIQVDGERAHLANQLQQLERDQVALGSVRERLAGLSASFMPLRNELMQMPVELRNQLVVLESYPGTANEECRPGFPCTVQQIGSAENNNPIQMPISATGNPEAMLVGTPAPQLAAPIEVPSACQLPPVGSSATPASGTPAAASTAIPPGNLVTYSGVPQLVNYLDQLPEEERKLLETGSPEEEYEDLVVRIVEEVVIPPLFAELNATKERNLINDFHIAKQLLCVTLNEHSEVLERHQLPGPVKTLGEITAIEERMHAHPLEPPPLESWWRTVPGKGVAAASMDADVQAFSIALQSPDTQLAAVDAKLNNLLIRMELDKQALDKKLANLEAQFTQVHGTFEQLAAPLPGIPVELKYAVLYYPIILAALFTSFVGRYVLDWARARQLVPLVSRLGVSTEALDVYLADYSIRPRRSDQRDDATGTWAFPALVLAAVVPTLLFAVSVAWIVSSPAFTEDRGWYVGLYALATLAMAGSYWALTENHPSSVHQEA